MDHNKYHQHRRNRWIFIGISIFFIAVGWMDGFIPLTIVGFALINLYGYFLMVSDKRKAKRTATRIPEASFFLISLFFGAVGVLAGMLSVRHKTKHVTFTLGIPALVIMNAVLIKWIFF